MAGRVPCLYAARPGLEIVGSVGVERIWAKSVWQTSLLLEKARATGFEVTAPESPDER